MLLQPSFFHRLLDDYPADTERNVTLMYKSKEVIQSLLFDLNLIFSSRSLSNSTKLEGELKKSVLNYGVIDVIDVDISDDERIDALSKNIEQAIACFEPRLKNVTIHLLKNTPENITFCVNGLFIAEHVSFSISWSSTAYTYTLHH